MTYTKYGYIWALLSVSCAIALCALIVMPHWLEGELVIEGEHRSLATFDSPASSTTAPPRIHTSFGVFRRCNYPRIDTSNGRLSIIEECGRYRSFGDIPSLWWQLSSVSILTAAAFALLPACIAIPALCIADVATKTSTRLLGLMQFLSSSCAFSSLLMYPCGWGAREVREACGWTSATFNPGACHLGWGLYTLLAVSIGLLLCSCLSTVAAHSVEWRLVDGAASKDGVEYEDGLYETQPLTRPRGYSNCDEA